MENYQESVAVPAQKDMPSIKAEAAREAAKSALAKSGKFTGQSKAPKSKTIYGGINNGGL